MAPSIHFKKSRVLSSGESRFTRYFTFSINSSGSSSYYSTYYCILLFYVLHWPLTAGYDLKWTFAKTFWSSSFSYITSMLFDHLWQWFQASLSSSFFDSVSFFDSETLSSSFFDLVPFFDSQTFGTEYCISYEWISKRPNNTYQHLLMIFHQSLPYVLTHGKF